MSDVNTPVYYGFYEYTGYGSRENHYTAIVKCTEEEARGITEKLNYHRGRLWDGKRSGSMGTPNFFSFRRLPVFESHDAFQAAVEERKQYAREQLILDRTWSSL